MKYFVIRSIARRFDLLDTCVVALIDRNRGFTECSSLVARWRGELAGQMVAGNGYSDYIPDRAAEDIPCN